MSQTQTPRSRVKLPAPLEEAMTRGYSVLPMGRDKHPAIKWKHLQERAPDRSQVLRWDRELKPSAWSVVTGSVSGLVILDFDGEAGAELLRRTGLEPHVRTGSGGAHVYVQHPGWRVGNFCSKTNEDLKQLISGLDLRGDGGYAVLCGQSSKGTYQQLQPLAPLPIDAVPPDLRQICHLDTPAAEATSPSDAHQGNGASHPHSVRVDADRLVSEALSGIGSEGRNQRGFWLAAQLRDNGYSESDAEGIVLNEYRPRAGHTNTKGRHEAYTEQEARASVREAYSRPAREPWAGKKQPAPNSTPEDAPVEESTPNITIPHGFELKPTGLYRLRSVKAPDGQVQEMSFRLGPPIRAIAKARTFEGTGYSVLVEFADCEGHERRLFIPRRLLYSDGSEAFNELLDRGYEPSSESNDIRDLKRYLCKSDPKAYVRIVTRVGWHGRSFVFPDVTVASKDEPEQALFYSEGGIEHRFQISGSLEEWRHNISRLCAGNKRLQFVVSCAFAAPMLGPCGLDNAGLHLVCSSSKGKTTSLLVAGSVFGGHPKTGFVDTWRNTANGLEGAATLHNDCLLALDELSEMPPKEVSETVYLLGNGQGKGRATKTGAARARQTFRMLYLSSGEKTLEVMLSEAGQTVRGGHGVRFIEVPAEFEKGRGLFECFHEHASAGDLATALKNSTKRYYGTAIRAFLQVVVDHYDSVLEELAEMREQFFHANRPEKSFGEADRKLKVFALVAACGELASRFGLTGWKPGEATEAARRCWIDSLAHDGAEGPRDIQQGIARLKQFLRSQGSARFFRLDTRDTDRAIPNLAGWVGTENIDGSDETLFFIAPETMQSEILKGLDVEEIMRELKRRGQLWVGKEKTRLQIQKRLPLSGSSQGFRDRVYAIRATIFEGISDGENEKSGGDSGSTGDSSI